MFPLHPISPLSIAWNPRPPAATMMAAAAAVAIQILRQEENKRGCGRAAGAAAAGVFRLWPALLRRLRVNVAARLARAAYAKAKMRFQSDFMLMTVQPFFFASS